MKVVLLAGGFGTRMSEYTELVPKPMVKIGGKPILWHIMNIYAKHGHTDFYLALGYKAELVKEYFLNYRSLNSDFTVGLKSGEIKSHSVAAPDWQVTLVDTGIASMTGGRVKRMRDYVGNETFMVTYGDGVANIDVSAALAFHKSHGKMVTVSAVRPAARFGELELDGSEVVSFKEKPQLHQGWINGGFFIMEPSIFDFIPGDETLLEREPLEAAAASGQLMAYMHEGFWQSMDTKREHELLEKLWNSGKAPWAN